MKKVELLAPAGDLEKLKIAILFGANAVFCGGKQFSLRAKANNFSLVDLKEAVTFANKHNAKVHVTVNIVPVDDDFATLDEYLLALDQIGVHAIIVSSIYIMKRAKEGEEIKYSKLLISLSDNTVYAKIFSTISSFLTNAGIK